MRGDGRMRPSLHEQLRGFAGALGLQGLFALFAADMHFDLLRLGFGLLGQADLQHALVVVRRNILSVHGRGQIEGAGEAAVLALDAAIVLLFLFFFELALAVEVRVLFSTWTSMSFSSIPGTSIFRVMLCSSS